MEVNSVRGYCALCTAHCATIAKVEGGRLVSLAPDLDHPNGGVLCIKGRAAPDLVYHPDRLNYPLRRTTPKGRADPGWERISWDEALNEIAERLIIIRDRYGPEAVALDKGTPSGTSVDDGTRWLSRFLNAFGSPNLISTLHICNWHKDTGFSYTFGVHLPIPDLERSRSFLLWGSNPSSTNPVLAHDIVSAKSRGMKVVSVDPRRIGVSGQADILLQVRPGADGALALALIHILIEEKLYDDEFVRQWTNAPFLLRNDTGHALTERDLTASGSVDRYVAWDETTNRPVIYDPDLRSFELTEIRPALFGERTVKGENGHPIRCKPCFSALAELARHYRPDLAEALTWVPAEKVQAAAELLAQNRPVSLYMWNGIGQHTNATQTSRAIATLYALLGDFDRPGGNVIFPVAPVNLVDGKELLSEEKKIARIGRKEKPLGPPSNPGSCAAYDIYTAILDKRPYPVKALLAFGTNSVMTTADSRRAREAFCALELAVAAELFMTPTAKLCDYVLPATSFMEMANLTTGFRYRPKGKTHLQYRPALVEPLAERRSDTWIVFNLARRLDLGNRFWNGKVDAGYEYELAPTGIALEKLKASSGGISVPQPLRFQKYADSAKTGGLEGFATPSRKVELYSHAFDAHGYPPLPAFNEPAVSPNSRPDLARDYPLVLTNAKSTTYIHSQLRALAHLRKTDPEPSAELHPQSAERHGIHNGEWMIIETPQGAIKVRAHVTDRIIPGVVCCQHGWWQECQELDLPGYDPYSDKGANSSILIGTDLADPISGSLPHRSYLCRIRPA